MLIKRKERGWIRYLLLCTVLLASVFCGIPGSSLDYAKKASATSKTAQEAISWVKSKLNTQVNGGECVGLIKAYYEYLGVSPVSGDGKDYAINSRPAGWSRVQGGTPQLGDILVYSGSNSNPYGHVAIYESARSTYHQNYANNRTVQHVTNVSYNGFTNPYWGYIRPNWSAVPEISQNPESKDKTPPVISDVRIIDRDSSGYTLECKVRDNQGIDRVQCPTWTVANGQDDIQKDWWTNPSAKATDKGNGIYQFRVRISDHKYEYGRYITHIYAYDTSGNYALSIADDIEVFEDRLQFYQGYGRGSNTMDGRDARVVGFHVVARNGDEGSELTITTTTAVNGEEIMKNESYTIEKAGRNVYYHLIDRSEYHNGDGDYTTTAVLKDKDGAILESKETVYNFANYADPYYVTVNVGEEVDIYEKTGQTDNKNLLRFRNWLWPDNCKVCTGEIEPINEDVYRGKKAGRVYASLCNISSAERTMVIIDVVDPNANIAGDINKDGKIDGKDISMLLQYRLGKRELTQAQIAAGDVYQDGKIDGKDVSKLLQYRLGKIASLE